jgi:hypothetical protein
MYSSLGIVAIQHREDIATLSRPSSMIVGISSSAGLVSARLFSQCENLALVTSPDDDSNRGLMIPQYVGTFLRDSRK